MVRKTKVTQKLNKRYENGVIKRKNIDKARRLTGGTIWDANKVLLDKEILALREEKEKEKENERERVVKKAIKDYNKRKKSYEDLISSRKEEKNYKGREFKIWINWKKREGNKAVSKKVVDLENRYNEIKERPDISLMEYLHNCGFMQNDNPMKAIVEKMIEDMEAERNGNKVGL